jgi:hypothetical protein
MFLANLSLLLIIYGQQSRAIALIRIKILTTRISEAIGKLLIRKQPFIRRTFAATFAVSSLVHFSSFCLVLGTEQNST